MNNFLKFLCRRILLVFVVICVVSAPACGHSFDDTNQESQTHKKDWVRCLGIDDTKTDVQKSGNLYKLLKETSAQIDDYETDYNRIKKDFPWFKWGGYTHRLIFHWGFNVDTAFSIKAHSVLVEQTNATLKEYAETIQKKLQGRGRLTDEERHFWAKYPQGSGYEKTEIEGLFRKLVEIQGSRRRATIEIARKYTEFRRYDCELFANLLYDIHMLGDQVSARNNEVFDAVISPERLEQDLIACFKKLFDSDVKKLGEVADELYVMRRRTGKERAVETMNIIEKYLPPILSEKYEKQLERKGIYLVHQEETKSQEGSK